MHAQRGYTLVELLVATAIAFVLGSLLLLLARATIFAASHLDARVNARSAADRFAERLISDASGAWSVFVPAADVRGASNADGHEIDFASEDASHRSYWWAYDFDAASSRAIVYAYSPGGGAMAGDEFDGITGLTAETHPIRDLADAASDAYDPLFAGDSLAPVDVAFDWGGSAMGGNHLVRVHFTAAGIDRTLVLSSGTAPSHFSVIVDYTPPPATPAP